MRTHYNMLFIILFSGIVFTLCGCSKENSEKYGEQISNRNATEIKDVLTAPEKFAGKDITIEGEIVRECNSGCWFDVKGNGGTIYVDIKPSGFAIPQKVGKDVIVEGKVTLRDGQLTLIGKGVEIK